MINILFVDDEPNILSGLQRMLYSMRREWRMSFANSGHEALDKLNQGDIDIIVSDMKMPRMDGAELLQQVSSQHPHVVRIILSGYSEKDMILKSIGAAHQYLSKPCDSEILKDTVNRACAVNSLLEDGHLRRIVSQMRSVPSLPTLYNALVEELNKPEPQIRRISEIVQKDIGMTAKILQIVNSAFFSLRRSISDADEAIKLLGLETVTALTLGVGVFSQMESAQTPFKNLAELWEKSLVVGKMAQQISRLENPEMANDSFTAGILHDIGEVVLAVNLPEKYLAAKKNIEEQVLPVCAIEREIFGTSHTEVGAYLLGLWGLPQRIQETVAFHHNPGDFPSNSFSPLTAVHVASVFQRHPDKEILKHPEMYFDVKHLEETGVIGKLEQWFEKCMS